MWEAFALFLLAVVTFLWIDTLRARESALAAGRAACERYGLMLLDDTVAVVKTRLARNGEGGLRIARTYEFEFSDTGNNRRRGAIELLGGEAGDMALEPYETGGSVPSGPVALPRAAHLTRVK